MENLSEKLETMRCSYRKFFLSAVSEIQSKIEELRPEGFSSDIFDCYLENSEGKFWQDRVVNYFETELIPSLNRTVKNINLLRNQYGCNGCGVCCRLACSEFSYEQIKLRADNGDNYAKQFVSTFVPYKTLEEVNTIYPQYLSLLNDNSDGDFYFYHCPKVTDENKCPDYENRPQICRDFPDNPIAFLPLSCGYNGWKSEVENQLLEVNAMMTIVEFYLSKIKNN